eukprot:5590313-Pleurochrysis_carterae.AAC.1
MMRNARRASRACMRTHAGCSMRRSEVHAATHEEKERDHSPVLSQLRLTRLASKVAPHRNLDFDGATVLARR